MKPSALMIAALALLTACASPNVQQYQALEPKLDLPSYFLGTTHAWGMFQRRGGTVVKRFKVEITGTGDAQQLTLDERFRYDDGTTQRRVWHLTRGADGRWLGRADDVEGEAQGEVAGNALHWQYTLLLPIDGSTYAMRFDDWMFLIDDCTMINRASMAKFGIELGQVTLMFRKANCPA
ncbi:DUF3833 domain-containing protein [Pseudoduganella danionis]|uniref:DUF3833 family protein n=1 Tax=Pseudoduganella danionis TaxID=1890295 RepID=A0ABW9SKV0_9BURK|nr:DUF3833 domain-containing protein [Pseudoduganella danionis]MTW32520.1 DUF3833 family protein [Pseudoduganella danionis]